jgi:gluconokinase
MGRPPSRVTSLPLFSGERAPGWHAAARACFYGVDHGTGPQELLHSLQDGVAFGLRAIADRLTLLDQRLHALSGATAERRRMLGSGTALVKSQVWAVTIGEPYD